MSKNRELHDVGQSLWIDSITRELVTGGTLKRYIDELSVTGLTSNPTIFDKALQGGGDYDAQISALLGAGKSGEDLFFELALEDLRGAADLFAPTHSRTAGVDGWVSLEVSPVIAYDAKSTIEAASTLHEAADRPNLFIKIPGTPAGLEAIEESIASGISINVTLLFSTEQYLAQAGAYMRGLERRVEAGLDPNVGSVASLFVSRWDVAVADRVPDELSDRLGVAVSTEAYVAYRDLHETDRWLRLANEGARRQRLLFASTGTKDPALPKTKYVEELAAPLTVNTMPEATLLAFSEEGNVGGLLRRDGGDSATVLKEFGKAGIDVGALGLQLQQEGAEKFEASWTDLLACISSKSEAVATAS